MTQLHTDSDYIGFLRDTYHWDIQEPWFKNVALPSKRYVQAYKDEIDSLKNALLRTYIMRSPIQDRDEKMKEYQTLQQEHAAVARWIHFHNKLKFTNILNILSNMHLMLTQAPQEAGEIYRSVGPLLTPLPVGFEERVEYVKNVEDTAYRFLAAMTDNEDMRKVLTKWKALSSGIQYGFKFEPETTSERKKKTIFTIDKFSKGIRKDAMNSPFYVEDMGELVKDAYLRELAQKCDLKIGATESIQYGVENILYQQSMDPHFFVAVQHDLTSDHMKLNLVLGADSLVQDKIVEATHGFLQRLAIQYLGVAPSP